MRLLVVLLALSCIWHPVSAQPKATRFAISGLGAYSCGKFLEVKSSNDTATMTVLAAWIEGFLSGANVQRYVSGKAFVALPDQASSIAFVEKHCREDPLSSLYLAASSLNSQLR